MRFHVLVAMMLAGCDTAPEPATGREIDDLRVQLDALQAQLDAEIRARTEADLQRDAALAALEEAGTPEAPVQQQLRLIDERLAALEAQSAFTSGWVDGVGLELELRVDEALDQLAGVQGAVALVDSLVVPYMRDLQRFVSVDRVENLVVVEGASLHVRSGGGATDAEPNGKGNLVIGYDEGDGVGKTGSHNLIVGPGHKYPSYGGVAFGEDNTVGGPASAVLGGSDNLAVGERSVIVGGVGNLADVADEVSL